MFTITATLNSIPINVNILSTSSSVLQILAPPSLTTSSSYSLNIKTPVGQVLTPTFTQTSANTPSINLLNTSAVSSGLNTISLNRTNLATKLPATIDIFNVLNPSNLYRVSSWSNTSTIISFQYNFDAGKYGFKLTYSDYGLASCPGQLQVSPAVAYSNTNAISSILGGQMIVTGADISADAVLRVGGFSGKVISKTSS